MPNLDTHIQRTKTDYWINIATALKLFSIFGNAYWMATFFNYAIKQDEHEDAVGLSRYAIAFGLLIGMFATIGFVLSHRALYAFEQNKSVSDNIQDERTEAFIPTESITLKKLTASQLTALVGCALACATDVAGPFGLVMKVSTANKSLSRNTFLEADILFFIFGMLCAIGETRACKNAMTNEDNPPADKWTKLTAAGEVSGICSDIYFFTRFFSLLFNAEKGFLDLSWYALPFGVFIGSIATAGEAYCHWHINTDHSEASEENNATCPWIKKVALVGDFIAQSSEFAALITFVVRLAMHKNPLDRTNEIFLNVGLLLLGSLGAVADVRKSYQTVFNQMSAAQPQQFPSCPLQINAV